MPPMQTGSASGRTYSKSSRCFPWPRMTNRDRVRGSMKDLHTSNMPTTTAGTLKKMFRPLVSGQCCFRIGALSLIAFGGGPNLTLAISTIWQQSSGAPRSNWILLPKHRSLFHRMNFTNPSVSFIIAATCPGSDGVIEMSTGRPSTSQPPIFMQTTNFSPRPSRGISRSSSMSSSARQINVLRRRCSATSTWASSARRCLRSTMSTASFCSSKFTPHIEQWGFDAALEEALRVRAHMLGSRRRNSSSFSRSWFPSVCK
mmetsp:Transcript_83428/g.232678  ORF Transcript_83428/g.232678 Transcript_83428/m.232678 type:complete len:258 (+) Transcript_83428:529-1302(+)